MVAPHFVRVTHHSCALGDKPSGVRLLRKYCTDDATPIEHGNKRWSLYADTLQRLVIYAQWGGNLHFFSATPLTESEATSASALYMLSRRADADAFLDALHSIVPGDTVLTTIN